jgi:DNA-directed RNA polymerase subunit K/omega
MEALDYWRLCEELNIVQAALLVIGENPDCAEYVEGWQVDKRPDGYEAAKTAICGGLKNFIRYEQEYEDFETQTANLQFDHPSAPNLLEENQEFLSDLVGRSIQGSIIRQSDFDINGNNLGFINGTIDLYRSTVSAESLKQWLRVKGFTAGFFFPVPLATMDFLDPSNTRYAPKLAAAVRAWQAVTDAGKKSPKQALDKWLREHAVDFGLTNDDGKPIEQAIEECSKVANWNAKGGATKTLS